MEGSDHGRSPVATSFTQSVEPGTGTSCTFIFAYQPLFTAMAKGAAAEVMVRAQNPTLRTASSACAERALQRRSTAAVTIFFINHHLSGMRRPTRPSGM